MMNRLTNDNIMAIQDWINILRSGIFRQVKETFFHFKDGRCAMGCILPRDANGVELNEILEYLSKKLGLSQKIFHIIMTLNDGFQRKGGNNQSFLQIANFLEAIICKEYKTRREEKCRVHVRKELNSMGYLPLSKELSMATSAVQSS